MNKKLNMNLTPHPPTAKPIRSGVITLFTFFYSLCLGFLCKCSDHQRYLPTSGDAISETWVKCFFEFIAILAQFLKKNVFRIIFFKGLNYLLRYWDLKHHDVSTSSRSLSQVALSEAERDVLVEMTSSVTWQKSRDYRDWCYKELTRFLGPTRPGPLMVVGSWAGSRSNMTGGMIQPSPFI